MYVSTVAVVVAHLHNQDCLLEVEVVLREDANQVKVR